MDVPGYSISLSPSLPPLLRETDPLHACTSVTVTVTGEGLHCLSTGEGKMVRWSTGVASRCCAGVGAMPRCPPETTSASLRRLTGVGELVAVMVLNTVE